MQPSLPSTPLPAAPGAREGHPVRRRLKERGFSLLVTVLLTGLLTMMGVAMLGLSTVTLHAAATEEPRRVARANARMAMALALGELQVHLGDDRRVTADSDILSESVTQPNVVGVWDSVAPTGHLANAQSAAPDYNGWKTSLFRKWLVSSSEDGATRSREFVLGQGKGAQRKVFAKKMDGFDLSAEVVPIQGSLKNDGGMAWAVSQDATRARIDLGQDAEHLTNDVVQAPSGPNVSLSGIMKQPGGGWVERGGRVVNLRQAALDPGYGLTQKGNNVLAGSFTTSSQGVLANVVDGGLKPDLSLAFDLSDADFKKARWDGVKNPFSSTATHREVPLYQPLNGGGPISITVNYSPVSLEHKMETGSAPTFQSLRSYYSMYRHLYRSEGQPTAFQRGQTSAFWPATSASGSAMGVGPVLDRVLFFLSLGVDDNDIVNLVVTPVITLWNPYNVAIETEGCVVYPWMDFPINVQWRVTNAAGKQVASAHSWLSTFVGSGDTGEGRSGNPYFFCQLTAQGDGSTAKPIHLAPGEVRVFTPSNSGTSFFRRTGSVGERTIRMKPVQDADDFNISGGLSIRMNESMWSGNDNLTYQMQPDDQVQGIFQFTRDQHHYYVTMEDAGRIHNPAQAGRILSEIQVMKGKLSSQSFVTPSFLTQNLKMKVRPVGVLETYHRTAGQNGQLADLMFTSNPRQRYVNNLVSASNFAAGPQYESSLRQVADVIGSGLQVSRDGRRAYFGYNNAADKGREYLSFFDLPQKPMISLGGFQNADLSDSAFGPASQFGNSWASAYLPRASAGRLVRKAPGGSAQPLLQPAGEQIAPLGLGIYDHSWLLNTSLWDGYFFSSISPETELTNVLGSPAANNSDQAAVKEGVDEVLKQWLRDPERSPLRNSRMTLHRGGLSDEALVSLLTSPAGCRQVAAHLLVEGAFNVNSTREEAWCAVLASLRGQALKVGARDGSGGALNSPGEATPFSRLRNPMGGPDDPWDGFRTLTDEQIKALAKEIVREIRLRGPAQSLGEFVNRRLSNDSLGLKGTLQAAIDRAGLNTGAQIERFQTGNFPFPSNLPEPYTGTGTPGWLTQADLLTGLAPFITVRSDTFTIRSYGEARDADGKVIATAWCEAVVQRLPEWLEAADPAIDAPEDVSPASARFGRRFEIRSFRELSPDDFDA